MSTSDASHSNLAVVPLGAGDLIDRAVRFYRKNFWTFILIAAPPVIVGTVVSVVWTTAARELVLTGGDASVVDTTLYFIFRRLGSVLIWLTETVATLVVMGGASRNFVRHLLFGEAITFKETYRNAAGRLGGLIVASIMITLLLGAVGAAIFYFAALFIIIIVGVAFWAIGDIVPVAAFIVALVGGLAVAGGAIWLFFLAASRLAYVPQVMLVEGQGVFSAIGRSASLASGNVRRLAALFIFSTVAAYSALALLFAPLAWYAAANGVQIAGFDADLVPAWYEITFTLIGQISFILLSPVWMVGLCLLYVDERVRSEGYDIELMAAARLGDIPDVPSTYINPLQPALSVSRTPAAAADRASITTLDLK